MAFDSLDIAAAVALFAATIFTWINAARLKAPARLPLRFAAMLLAALAAAMTEGLAGVAALFLLPLAAASVALAALARFARPLNTFAASVALVLALACGFGAMLSGMGMLALLPGIVASLAIIAAALNGVAWRAAVSGAALLACVLAFGHAGAHAGMALLAAAALIGLSLRVQLSRRSAGRGAAAP